MLCGLSHEATVLVVRAFTYFSQLSNIAEDCHYIRSWRAYQLAGSKPREGDLARALQRAADAYKTAEALLAGGDDAEQKLTLQYAYAHVFLHLSQGTDLSLLEEARRR